MKQELSKMTLDQKLGQLIVTGFPAGEVNDAFRELVEEYSVGNVILFRYNQFSYPQLKGLCRTLTEWISDKTGIPPFITSDEEGGIVSRLPEDMGKMPSAMGQAALGDEMRVRRAAFLTGEELRDVGINFNLAPVLDINSNSANPVIGVRSYGTDSAGVSRFALAALAGYEQAGVITTGKHFPGHGDTETDSHLALPVIRKSLEALEEAELIPFRKAIAAGVPAITIAHILFPALEPGNVPGTMSRNIITGLLREKLGFRGLAISDCMEMNAIKETVGVAKGTVEAVKAGMDLIFISRTPGEVKAALAALHAAVETGELPMARVDEAVGRILACKKKYLLPFPGLTEQQQSEIRIFADSFGSDVIRHSCVGGNVPFVLGSRPFFLAPDAVRPSGAANQQDDVCNFAASMQQRFGGEYRRILQDPAPEQTEPLCALARQSTSVVLGTVNGNMHPGQMALAQRLAACGVPFALVALRNPFELEQRPAGCFGCALYEYAPARVKQAFALFAKAPGRHS